MSQLVSRYRIPLVLLALVLIGAALWFFILAGPPAADEPTLEKQAKVSEAGIAPGPGMPGGASAKEPALIETVPITAERARLEAEIGEPLDPDYGPLLQRGTASITFSLSDANGRRLESFGWKRGKAKLWRRQGPWWTEAPLRLDLTHRRVFAGGAEASLEPGEYELSVSLGSYGVAHSNFSVGREAEGRDLPLRLPGEYRIITLVFRDPAGRAIPFLSDPPTYKCSSTLPLAHRRGVPRVLKDPPRRGVIGLGGGRGGSFGRRRGRRRYRYPTDGGRYHMEVIAGRKGTIKIPLDPKLFKTKSKQLESDFRGPQWQDYELQLEPSARYAQLIESYKTQHPGDPGRRQLLAADPPPLRVPDRPVRKKSLKDPSDLGRYGFRLLLTLDAPEGIFPFVKRSGRYFQLFDELSGGQWMIDLRTRGWSTNLNTSDGRFFRGEGVEVPEGKGGQVIETARSERTVPCSLRVSATPTLVAWARAVSFRLDSQSIEWDPGRSSRKQEAAERQGLAHSYDSYLSPRYLEALSSRVILGLAYGASPSARLSFGSEESYSQSMQVFRFDLDKGERSELATGLLQIDLQERLDRTGRGSLLLLRCVGDRDEGVSGVEATILKAKDAAISKLLHDQARRLQAKGLRPDAGTLLRKAWEKKTGGNYDVEISSSWIDRPQDLIPLGELPGETPEELRKIFGEELWEAYGLEGLSKLRAFGAWYDVRSKMKSDNDGYIIARQPRLLAGELYILHLWSKSRNDLEPDRRLVFRASEGISDLGVLRVPSH